MFWTVTLQLFKGFGTTLEIFERSHDKEKNRTLTEKMFVELIKSTRKKNGHQ